MTTELDTTWHVGSTMRRCAFIEQAVRMATQYASALCKLTISSHLFAGVAPVPAYWLFKTATS